MQNEIVEARQKVNKIKEAINQGDYEEAHNLEDNLYKWTLNLIAIHQIYGDQAQLLAIIALDTSSIDYPRYRA